METYGRKPGNYSCFKNEDLLIPRSKPQEEGACSIVSKTMRVIGKNDTIEYYNKEFVFAYQFKDVTEKFRSTIF